MPDGSNDYGVPHDPTRFQDVQKQSWPTPDVAERIKDHASIDVTVRLVFARDGEAWLDGQATRWHGQHVFVTSDPVTVLGWILPPVTELGPRSALVTWLLTIMATDTGPGSRPSGVRKDCVHAPAGTSAPPSSPRRE